ncbi:MAG: hypothetical protein R6U62_09670 [Bacteroidales bacterium]
MSANAFHTTVDNIASELNDQNVKDKKNELIDLQRDLNAADLEASDKSDLKQKVQQLFDRIRELQEKEQQQFEQEADDNHGYLKGRLYECIDFVQDNPDDLEEAWEKLLALQDDFRGRRMRSHQRETLYAGLQELFDIVKKRREEAKAKKIATSETRFEELHKEVARLVDAAEKADLDTLWSGLKEIADSVRQEDLIPAHRKQLFELLDEGFAIAKIRKEERQQAFREESDANAAFIEQQLEHATEQIENNQFFKENWQLLLDIQQAFRDLTLEKSRREDLYAELQLLFDSLKAKRSKEQETFEQAADESVEQLKPLVDKATKLARTSREFKKTKHFLIRVQKDFKGRRMRKEERESLYSKLQSAFDTLNNRINEHIAAKKDIHELKVESKLSDLRTKMEELETSMEKDMEEIRLMEHKLEDIQVLDRFSGEVETLQHQLQMMRAALDKKAGQLRELQDQEQQAQDQKEWLDGIE